MKKRACIFPVMLYHWKCTPTRMARTGGNVGVENMTRTEFNRLAREQGRTLAVMYARMMGVKLPVVQLWEVTL
jgi:hypothetical protein